jgi:hypothetical protein
MNQEQQSAAANSNPLTNPTASGHVADGNISPQEDYREEGGMHDEPSAPSGSGADSSVGIKRPVRCDTLILPSPLQYCETMAKEIIKNHGVPA